MMKKVMSFLFIAAVLDGSVFAYIHDEHGPIWDKFVECYVGVPKNSSTQIIIRKIEGPFVKIKTTKEKPAEMIDLLKEIKMIESEEKEVVPGREGG